MTTIAYDGETLAVDSLVTSGNLAFGASKKLFKLKDGGHFALCGHIALAPEIMVWLQGGAKPELGDDEEVGGIFIDKRGNAFEFGNALRLFPACVPWAGGSGEHIVLTAFECGKSAVEAVEIACKLDTKTRLPVQSVKIKRT